MITLYSFMPDVSLYVPKHLKPFINLMTIIQLAFNLWFLFQYYLTRARLKPFINLITSSFTNLIN